MKIGQLIIFLAGVTLTSVACFAYLDSKTHESSAEVVKSSGALPPAKDRTSAGLSDVGNVVSASDLPIVNSSHIDNSVEPNPVVGNLTTQKTVQSAVSSYSNTGESGAYLAAQIPSNFSSPTYAAIESNVSGDAPEKREAPITAANGTVNNAAPSRPARRSNGVPKALTLLPAPRNPGTPMAADRQTVNSAPLQGSPRRGNGVSKAQILLPASLAPQNTNIPITTDTQVVKWEKLQNDFIEGVGGSAPKTQDPASRARWMSQRYINDRKFARDFGHQAFLLQNAQAWQQSGE